MSKNKNHSELDKAAVKKEVVALLRKHHDATILFFKFLSMRQRTSKESDVSQLIAYMRHDAAFNIERTIIVDIFMTLASCGIGELSGDDSGRMKFQWRYWIFPIFDKLNPDRLRGLELKDRNIFENNRNHLSVVKHQVETYALNLSSPDPKPNLKPDVIFDDEPNAKPDTTVTLSGIPTEELLAELTKRGVLTISLNKNSDSGEKPTSKK